MLKCYACHKPFKPNDVSIITCPCGSVFVHPRCATPFEASACPSCDRTYCVQRTSSTMGTLLRVAGVLKSVDSFTNELSPDRFVEFCRQNSGKNKGETNEVDL